MVRVLFYTGALMLAVSAALLYLPTYFSVIIATVLSAALILLFILHKKIRVNGLKTMLFILLAFTLWGIFTKVAYIEPAEALAGYKAEITGTVCDRPERYEDYSVYKIKTEKIKIIYENGQQKVSDPPQSLTVHLSDSTLIDADVFDKLKLEVTFTDLDKYKYSYLSSGVYAGGYITSLKEHLGVDRPFYAFFYDLRDNINDLLYKNINYDEATVISAVLIGDRSRLSDDFYGNSKMAGITHILVVSGMHLGILFQLFDKIFKILKLSKRTSALFLIGGIFAIEAICGFTPSILRAGLTYFILAFGRLLFRRPDSLNSLGAATVIILFTMPLGFGNLSLLLSLFSTFGLLFLCPVFYNSLCALLGRIYKIGRLTKSLAFSVCQTVSATLMTLPVSIIFLGYFSVVSVIANLLVGYAVTVLTVLAFVSVILLCLPSVFKAAAAIPVIILCLLVRYIVYVTEFCASMEWAITVARPAYLIPCFTAMLIVPALMLITKFRDRAIKAFMKILAVILALFTVASFLILYTIPENNSLAVLDVGKGNSIVFTHNGKTVVIGAGDTVGDAYTISYYLTSNGKTKIDYLILPTATKAFAGGAPELEYKCSIDNFIYPSHGDYYDKIKYISEDNFTAFDTVSKINTDEFNITNIADVGCVIDFYDGSVIIYTGDGDIKRLFEYSTNSNVIFISANALPESLPENVSEYILSGSDENIEAMSKRLNEQSIEFSAPKNGHLILDI